MKDGDDWEYLNDAMKLLVHKTNHLSSSSTEWNQMKKEKTERQNIGDYVLPIFQSTCFHMQKLSVHAEAGRHAV